MVRTAKVIFCDNEHGSGDKSFPEYLGPQQFIEPLTVGQIRKQAKAAGWGRIKGQDFCAPCWETMCDEE